VSLMRRVVEDEISSADAVKEYHDRLQKAGIKSHCRLDEELEITETVLRS